MDTKELGPLNPGQLEAIREVAKEQWRDVLDELRKSTDPKVLAIIEVVAGHLYTGGYVAGAEHMHESIRGIK